MPNDSSLPGEDEELVHADDRISNCEFGEDGYVYMCSNHRLIRAKAKVKKIVRKNA